MTDKVLILKDEDNQMLVPEAWRNTFTDIVEAFKDGDFKLERGVHGVRPVSEDDAARIASNLANYGCHLISLPEETWNTSMCQWMQGYWDVLIDLFTSEEGASDLVLAVRVYEEGSSYIFEIQSIHVP
ncbi:MAG: DUF7668 domain-containing protein [Gammaproteobacteria bacterium]